MYTNTESCCVLKTNVMLYANYTSIKKIIALYSSLCASLPPSTNERGRGTRVRQEPRLGQGPRLSHPCSRPAH